MAYPFIVRELHPGMGQAVAERTVLRGLEGGQFETWGHVAHRVALGNTSLMRGSNEERAREFNLMRDMIANGGLLMSGRHLQHGDEDQASRNMEVFTNCATAPTSFLMFQLLLNGSGVGRCYDDDMMLVDWDNAPTVWCVLDEDHPDYTERHLSARNARHMFNGSKDMMWFEVPDNREGWAKALEIVEVAAFEKVHRDKLLVLDFSGVRCKGSPIKGMQGRPSSGPVPLMDAFAKMSMVCRAGLPRWKQVMYIDHFFAECVLVGGARRAARMAMKHWLDKNVIDFAKVKRPVEYDGKNLDEVIAFREALSASGEPLPYAFLWSSNNSIAVDEEFWAEAGEPGTWANEVFSAVTACAYGDGTGEPGFVNVDKLPQDDEGWEGLGLGDYVGSSRYQVEDNTQLYLSKLAKRAVAKPWHMITNPCGEIALSLLGAYCSLAALAPYLLQPQALEGAPEELNPGERTALFEEWDDRFEQAARVAARAAVRINTMDCLYAKEVRRTNRIGVGLVGVHEWMWARFGLTFHEALDWTTEEAEARSMEMWDTLARVSRAVQEEADAYSARLGLPAPHTVTTIPPGGTISKLFALTEGAHLPAMPWYLRWVQFRNDDPLVKDYGARGYPIRVLKQYRGHTIVGFPTRPLIAEIMPHNCITTAGDATMDEQYDWLRMLERHWLKGGHGEPVRGNQVSYTLKYDPDVTSYWDFGQAMLRSQRHVRACAVMPQIDDDVAFEYQPEEPITRERYEALVACIEAAAEEVDEATMGCENGACPVEFNDEKGVVREAGYA